MNDVLTLIAQTFTEDALKQQIAQDTERKVFCEVSSIQASEFAQAGQEGLKAEWRVKVFRYDYQGERAAIWNGQRYEIYRTYLGKNEKIELYLARRVSGGNAKN